MGIGDDIRIGTLPPWKSDAYSDPPEGTVGTMESPDKTSLTSIPYHKHKMYSPEKRAQDQKEYDEQIEQLKRR